MLRYNIELYPLYFPLIFKAATPCWQFDQSLYTLKQLENLLEEA